MQIHKRELVLPNTIDGKRERDARLAIVTVVILSMVLIYYYSTVYRPCSYLYVLEANECNLTIATNRKPE